MDLQRRFAFHGTAAAIGGRLVLPSDVVLESSAASCLPISGGRSVSRVGPQKYGDAVTLGSASTFAEGLIDDPRQGDRATTRASAEVRDLAVGTKPRLTIARLHAALSAKSPLGGGEAAIRPVDDNAIEGVAVDGHKLSIVLGLVVFQQCDTHAKLVASADEEPFVAEHGGHFFMRTALEGRPVPSTGRLIEEHGTIHATIVRQISWAGDPYPGATIHHNMVVIPNFGRVFFGELRITRARRRLTLVRFRLGSPVTGDVSACDVETNGTWSP